MMINGAFAYRPQSMGAQSLARPVYYNSPPSPQPVLTQAQPLTSQASGAAGFGNWFSPVMQSIGNAYPTMAASVMNTGQAAGRFLSQGAGFIMNGFNNMMSGVAAMQPRFNIQPLYSISAPQSLSQIGQQMGTGAKLALQQMGGMLTEHAPAALAFGGAVAASTGVCAFMGGVMLGSAGIAMGQHLINRQ